ncbi:MAG: FISUMP domain-containing protein [Bacteroidales bacterium]|jgi:uncharacterized protein (TIGR02145 family)|nr:FISUMP domain-containing protein [Bacteroidales bacterium]
MRNNLSSIKSFFLLAILTNFTLSCVKEEFDEITPNEDGSIVFICGNNNDPVTKTTLNGLTTHWVENTDKVGLFSPQASTTSGGAAGVVNIPLTAQSSGERAQFSGTVFWGTGEHNFYSYYPYKEGTPSHSAVTVSLPKDQIQSAGNNLDHLGDLDFLVAKPYTAKHPGTLGNGASVSLRYNHLFTILEFQIIRSTGSGAISKVKLTGNIPLGFESGTIDLSQSTPASGVSYVIDGMSNTSNSVTVSLGTSITPTGDYSTTPRVYMVVLPGAHTGDMKISFESAGVFKEIKKSNVTFERGKKYIVKVDADLASIPVISGSDLEPVTLGNIIWSPLNVGYRSGLENGLLFQWFRPNGVEGILSDLKLAANSLWTLDLDQETAADKYRDYYLTTGVLPNDWMPVKQTEWNMSRKFNPCPDGWRVPTRADFDALIASGSTAVTNPILGVDNMQGRWYGPNHNNPDVRATTAVFLPVTYTVGTGGGARVTSNTNSYYWTTSAAGTNNRDGVVLYFSPSSATNSTQTRERANGGAIRCVKDVDPSVNAVLYTIKPYDIKYDGATIGGNIEYQGSHPITERGVFYGTAVDPASTKVIASAAGVGEFSVILIRLEPNKTYFVRAYAKNSAGTTYYGDQYKFTTLASHVADYGGQEVTINGVTWAPWNAGYVEGVYPYGLLYQWHRRFGQVYDTETPLPTFANPNTVVEVNYYSNKDKFFFYTTSTYKHDCLSAQQSSWSMDVEYNPCPVGWKVPTQAQFQSLIDSGSSPGVGPNGLSGRWFGPNHSGDKSGCIFLPVAGYRFRDGLSNSRGIRGDYWSTTTSGTNSYFLDFDTTPSNVNVALFTGRACGMSIRCVKE